MLCGRKPAFCTGCEFAGSIPAGAPLNRTFTSKKGEIAGIAFMDNDFRISSRAIHAQDIGKAPDQDHVARIISDCEGKECGLEAAGFIPVDVTDIEKKKYMLQFLNGLQGVKEIGGVNINIQPQE